MRQITFGENVARLRKERGLTQEQLAKELCLSRQAVAKWEKGICHTDIEMILQVADYFGVSLEEILFERGE